MRGFVNEKEVVVASKQGVFDRLTDEWDNKPRFINKITGESERLLKLMPSLVRAEMRIGDYGWFRKGNKEAAGLLRQYKCHICR
jgi:hypothetical protein